MTLCGQPDLVGIEMFTALRARKQGPLTSYNQCLHLKATKAESHRRQKACSMSCHCCSCHEYTPGTPLDDLLSVNSGTLLLGILLLLQNL